MRAIIATRLTDGCGSKAGSARFYLLTTSMAGVWAVGALGAGPVPWRGEGCRDYLGSTVRGLVIVPVASGAATFALFYGAARAGVRTLRQAAGRRADRDAAVPAEQDRDPSVRDHLPGRCGRARSRVRCG